MDVRADVTRRHEHRFACQSRNRYVPKRGERMAARQRQDERLFGERTDDEIGVSERRMQDRQIDRSCCQRGFQRRRVHLRKIDIDIRISAAKGLHGFRQSAVEGDHREPEAQSAHLAACCPQRVFPGDARTFDRAARRLKAGGVFSDDFIDGYNANMAIPWTAAERGYIDAVIQPHETRLLLPLTAPVSAEGGQRAVAELEAAGVEVVTDLA